MKGFKEKSRSAVSLDARIKANQNAERDFDEWCLNLFPKISLKANILDLGCGTGKQINLFAEFLGRDSKIFALDISGDSLKTLKNNYSFSPDTRPYGGEDDE